MPRTPNNLRSTRSNSVTNTTSNFPDATTQHDLSSKIASIVAEQLSKLLEPLIKQIQQILADYKSMSDEINQLRNDYKVINEKLADDILEEVRQREMRKDFIILSGVPERQDCSLEERKVADEESIRAIANELNCPLNFTDTHRIGKQTSTRPRLLRFKCTDVDDRNHLLKYARRLRSSNESFFTSVYINPDRTPRERVKRKLLTEELRRRRQEGEDVIIKHGKVIRNDRIPTLNFQ